MDSRPSTSTWPDPFIFSDDSGLRLTGSSVSSGSISGESHNFSRFATDMQDSDWEDKSFSQTDSLNEMSDILCGENFKTLKKGPHWLDIPDLKSNTPIGPPLEFEDEPNIILYESIADSLIPTILNEAIKIGCKSVDSRSSRQLVEEQIKNYESEMCLPLKKRRIPVSDRIASKYELKITDYKEEISYPATPMISIAEIEVLHQNQTNLTKLFNPPSEWFGHFQSNNDMVKQDIVESATIRRDEPIVSTATPYTKKIPEVRIPENKRRRGRPKRNAAKKIK